jgi:hypothetical protein
MTRTIIAILYLSVLAGPVLAQTVEASNWNEALAKVPCDSAKRNPNGSWLITKMIVVEGSRFNNPTIADRVEASLLEKRCLSKPDTFAGRDH